MSIVAAGDALPPADDRLYGPVAFGPGWLLVGIAALVIAGAMLAWVLWPARPPAIVPEAKQVVGLRARYLRRLDELERQFSEHRVTPRALHHELSRTLRHLARDAGTDGATSMSASALDAAGLRHLAAAVRGYEQPQFEELPETDPLASLSVARAVVSAADVPRADASVEDR